ncbi:MAG TPA: response regulator, partial [Blastocatellia bacterium]|nr:response regulator [Blastocatellia bacterium]
RRRSGRNFHCYVALINKRSLPGTATRNDRILAEADTLEGVRVLVVDDDADLLEMITSALRQSAAEVIPVLSAAEGIQALRELRPDVMISDIGMPEMDGYDLIQQIRSLPPDQGGRIPAIALTAYARAEDRTRTLKAGYQMHMAKPVDPDELVAVIASLVERP